MFPACGCIRVIPMAPSSAARKSSWDGEASVDMFAGETPKKGGFHKLRLPQELDDGKSHPIADLGVPSFQEINIFREFTYRFSQWFKHKWQIVDVRTYNDDSEQFFLRKRTNDVLSVFTRASSDRKSPVLFCGKTSWNHGSMVGRFPPKK